MIKQTRLASNDEKEKVLAFISHSLGSFNSDSEELAEINHSDEYFQNWKNASFIVIEVEDFAEKLVVANKISPHSGEVLDINTAYFLIRENGQVRPVYHSGMSSLF